MKLEGVKVVDFSMFLPGPHFTMMMADHGAEVIRIEPMGGEPARALGLKQGEHTVWFRNTHRGKQSVRLNLKDPRGLEFAMKLLEDADVLVEGFRPGVMERLGLGYEAVRARAPQVVYVSLSAFGQTGRYRLKPAHDMVMQAMLGVLSFNLGRDGKPANPHMPVADMCGSLTAFAGVLMALFRQRQTGQGDYLDISMHDSVLAWTANYQGPVMAEHRAHDVKQERNWGGAAFYNIYETKDRQWMVLGGVEHTFCENFLNKAGRPDLIPPCHQPPGPVQEPVKVFLAEFFGARTQAEALAWLEGLDVCYAPLRTLLEGVFDPNTAERGMLITDEAGCHHLGIPIKYTREPGRVDTHVPALGEHSKQVAARLGYSAERIAELERDKVI
ncbi:MAG: CoA transferase [Gammaproteobacteria bacterium]|nr:CoA transferase [Gammaproteobacteria bacterium]